MADNTGTAVAAASAAAAFASGNYISAAASAIQAISGLVGGGEGYAQSTGYEVKGTVSNGQFSGAVTGLSSNGTHNYRISEAEGAYGERRTLNEQVATLWQKYFPDNPADVSFPLDFTGPYNWYGSIAPAVESIFSAVSTQRANNQTLLDLFKGSAAVNAPDMGTITGATDPTGASAGNVIDAASAADASGDKTIMMPSGVKLASGDSNAGGFVAAMGSPGAVVLVALGALLYWGTK